MDWSNGRAGKAVRVVDLCGEFADVVLVIGDNESEILKLVRNEVASV